MAQACKQSVCLQDDLEPWHRILGAACIEDHQRTHLSTLFMKESAGQLYAVWKSSEFPMGPIWMAVVVMVVAV